MADRCCCGLISITVGARVLSIISILCSLGSLVQVLHPMNTLLPWYRLGTLVVNIAEIGAAVLAFIACKNGSAVKMVPMLCYCPIAFLWWAFVFVISTIGVFYHSETHLPYPIYAAISFSLQIWFTTVFWSCYSHLRTNGVPLLTDRRA